MQRQITGFKVSRIYPLVPFPMTLSDPWPIQGIKVTGYYLCPGRIVCAADA